ncbi:uncharacterized protein LOC117265114 isoform X2 [Epinephelus lanceolatus]
MQCDEKSPSHCPQCPPGTVGRRDVEVQSKQSGDERVELLVRVKTSTPEMSVEFSACFCEDSEACMCKNGLFDSPSPLSLSPATAAAQTQMPSTKPKARTLVTCRQLSDGSKAASLRDQSPPPLLILKGTASVMSTDPRGIPSIRAFITLEERKQQIKRERGSNAVDEQKHNETMQHSVWGMPGSGAPNYHLGTVKRTKSLHAAGILPQEQIRDKGFSGTPFRCL